MTTSDSAAGGANAMAAFSRIRWGRYSVLLIWLVLMLYFWTTQETFLTEGGLRFTLSGRVTIGFMTLGLLLPLAAGVFDISVGAMVGFSGMFLVWLEETNKLGENVWLHIIVVLALCAGWGFINGILVVRFRINSFIATLGMASVIQATTFLISENQRIAAVFSEDVQEVVEKEWPGFANQLLSFWYLLIVAAFLLWLTEFTPVGRYLYATGGNPEAARLAGVRTGRYIQGSLVGSAVLAGIGGMIFVIQQDSASPDTGPPLLFAAFAAAFLGATQFTGRPNVPGTVVAIFMLSFLSRGLQIEFPGNTSIDPYADGIVLILAVAAASIDWAAVKRGWRRLTGGGGGGGGSDGAGASATTAAGATTTTSADP